MYDYFFDICNNDKDKDNLKYALNKYFLDENLLELKVILKTLKTSIDNKNNLKYVLKNEPKGDKNGKEKRKWWFI